MGNWLFKYGLAYNSKPVTRDFSNCGVVPGYSPFDIPGAVKMEDTS